MTHSRRLLLLLLLTALICAHLPEAQGKDTEFWCNDQDRTNMQTRTENLNAECVHSDALPSPVQLPCVWLRVAEWNNKTLQQKSAEVMGALRLFLEGVQSARNQSDLQNPPDACGASKLKILEQHIKNYIAIVNPVYEQNGASQSAVHKCSSVKSLSKVLDQFIKLLRGKLQCLAISLRDSMCDHRT